MNNFKLYSQCNGSEIAIISLTGCFPGAENLDKFWNNLRNGVESISFFSNEELAEFVKDETLLHDPNFVKAKAVLKDVESFDASFFGFNPREAEITDPQHRLLLECAWEALEAAGYNSETYKGSIGIYAGTSLNNYFFNLYSNPNILNSVDGFQLLIGSDKDFLTTRISYKLNLEGPSYTVQTACSTSLVAVHLACQSLLNGECDMALAGGVSIGASRKSGYLYKDGGIQSPDGHCRAFDAKAQGTPGGEGVGLVVLKRLEDALADRDFIHAVIKGSATNNDGSFKVSYTAPRIDSQAKAIRTAQVVAEVEPETITYIEAHGTGTALGDPIEIAALTQAFRTSTQKKGFCAVGSVKTNIGHLDVAAGVAGLIKTVLALKHKQIPPTLHFQQPNPKIDFANSPFYVNSVLSEWKANGTPRRAGVSSFGIGGTNAHVILEEAPTLEPSGPSRSWQLLLLSAKTDTALETATANLAEYLKQHPDLNLADVAYTLQVGRRAFDHRRIVVCQNFDDAVQTLSPPNPQRVLTHYQKSCHRPVVFMFSGQGAQYVNMARELYQSEPTFTLAVDRCTQPLKPHLELDLRTVLYPSAEKVQEAAQYLTQTAITQPALFVIEYALAKLWMSWGVHPEALIGHSIGEYVAACLAGVFSLEDALALVAQRGRLMQQLPSGAMLSVKLSEKEVQPLLEKQLSLAGSNTPYSCVVSGPTEAIDQLQEKLLAAGIDCRKLHTSHAFHSQMMDPIIEPFTQLLRSVKLNPPKIPLVSNVSGTWMTATEATNPDYWAKHLRQTVRFTDGIAELLREPERILLEVGPGRTLSTFVKQHQNDELVALTSMRHPKEQQSDVAFLLNTLGRLWLLGVKLDWAGFYAQEQRYRLPLPTYPFERQRYWIEPQEQAQDVRANQRLLGKKPDIADWFYLPFWKPSRFPMQLEQRDLEHQKSCTLVFMDECGLGSELVKKLEQQNRDLITVRIGSEFTQQSEGVYTLNPRQSSDYDALFNELLTRDKFPQTIVHLWSVTPLSHAESGVELFEEVQQKGFYSLLFLAQALGKQSLTDEVQITVVSNHMQTVNAEEILCPEKATVIGAVKVIPQEYTNISCRSIDVIFPLKERWQEEKLIDQLLREFTAPMSDSVIAYRGFNRWVQTFEPVQLNEAKTIPPQLKEGGVYLITGGLGGIGLVLAEYLAKTVRAKLILMGRSALPNREEWSQWLITHDEQNHVSQKIRKIVELEEFGAEVLVVSADVTNLKQMQEAIALAEKRVGQLNGVIHAAGIAGGGAIQLKIPEIAASVLSPKVSGAKVLDTIFNNKKLDFFVLCSSINSLLGGFGQVDYCAANAFLDAFAYSRSAKEGTFTVSINWDTWQEVGMAVNTAVPAEFKQRREESLKIGISSEEGKEVFHCIMCNSLPQLIVSTKDFQLAIAQSKPVAVSTALEELGQFRLSKSIHPRPNLKQTYIPPSNETEKAIADIWRELLGIEQIGLYDNFFELGGDSLLIVQLRSKLQKTFNKGLPIADLFEYPTVSALAEYLSLEQVERPTFRQVHDRAKKKQEAIQEKRQLMNQRRKTHG